MSDERERPTWLPRDERIQWEGQPRTAHILPSVVIGVLFIIGSAWAASTLSSLFVLGAIIGLLIIGWSYLYLQRLQYVVTEHAVWAHSGVLSRTVRRISLEHVQNVGYTQSVRGSLFGYGTVSIEVAGGADMWFRDIKSPQAVMEYIESSNSDRAQDRAEIPGSVAQWRSIYKEVAAIREFVEKDRL